MSASVLYVWLPVLQELPGTDIVSASVLPPVTLGYLCSRSYQVPVVPSYVLPLVTQSYLGLPSVTCVTRVTRY